MGGGTGTGGKIDVRITDEGAVLYGVLQSNKSTLHMDGTTPASGKVRGTSEAIEAMSGNIVRIEVISTRCDPETGMHTIPHKGCFLR